MSLVEYEVQSLRIQVVMRTHALGEWMLHALGNLNNMGAVASATESLEGSRATKVLVSLVTLIFDSIQHGSEDCEKEEVAETESVHRLSPVPCIAPFNGFVSDPGYFFHNWFRVVSHEPGGEDGEEEDEAISSPCTGLDDASTRAVQSLAGTHGAGGPDAAGCNAEWREHGVYSSLSRFSSVARASSGFTVPRSCSTSTWGRPFWARGLTTLSEGGNQAVRPE
eukprot:scaffold287_cov337-Pavlova_lutheri.AAC.53